MPNEFLSEGYLVSINFLTWGLPFLGFYVGMILRHVAFRKAGPDHPTFLQRLALGLPVSLIIVASFNALLAEIGAPSVASVIFAPFVCLRGFASSW